MISITWYPGHDVKLLEDSYKIRREVFINEYGLDEKEEFDKYDNESMHIVLYDNGEACACGRLRLIQNNNGCMEFIMGHIAVLKHKRGMKYGDFVVRNIVRKAFDCGAESVIVNSVPNAVNFYTKLGFEIIQPQCETNHITMKRYTDFTGC